MPLESPANVGAIVPSGVEDPPGDRYSIALRNVLRVALAGFWPNNPNGAIESIEVMPDDRPKPNCGPLFIAIRSRTDIDSGEGYEIHQVSPKAAITLRTDAAAWDRVGLHKDVLSGYGRVDPRRVLSAIARAVTDAVADRTAIPIASNTDDRHLSHEPIIGVLRLESISESRIVTGEHFSSPNEEGNGTPEVGLLKLVSFRGGLSYIPRVDGTVATSAS